MAKILVVDDDVDARDLLKILIQAQGRHSVFFANDGVEALKVARDAMPDLIITDIKMPNMDGYEFVRRLRTDPVLKKTEVIFYSAYFFEQAAAFGTALSLGVTNVLFKPTEPDEILKAIDTALSHVKHHT
jgi:CheY-like chemotaxis protein